MRKPKMGYTNHKMDSSKIIKKCFENYIFAWILNFLNNIINKII